MRKPLRHDFVVPPLLSGEASLRWLLRSNCNGIAGKFYITGKSVPLNLWGVISVFMSLLLIGQVSSLSQAPYAHAAGALTF